MHAMYFSWATIFWGLIYIYALNCTYFSSHYPIKNGVIMPILEYLIYNFQMNLCWPSVY